MTVKFGRLARTFDPRVPHYSSLRMGMPLQPPPPVSVDYAAPMPTDWGMMLNDQLGDCTCAGAYHTMQLWSHYGRNVILTEPDAMVLNMYEEFCGYRLQDPKTDRGGVEQDVLRRWLQVGVPIKEGGGGRSRLKAYVEIDPRNHDDVKRAIADCGSVYIGMIIPRFVADNTGSTTWDLVPGVDTTSVGGHCVVCPGYDADKVNFVSWGLATYHMTWAYWDTFVDEVYALVHPWWIGSTGQTIGGLSLADLEAAMAAMQTG